MMRTFKLTTLAVMAILATTSFAQAQNKKPRVATQQAVADAVERIRQLMVTPDSAALSAMASEKLSFGHSGGKVQNKQEFLHSFLSGETDFTSLEFTDQTITVSGNTAIVRHTLSGATNDKGKAPGNVKLFILLVWQKVKGQWVLLARQAVKPPVA